MKWKLILKFLSITVGILLLINTAIMAVIANFNLGVVFSGILAIGLLLCGVFLEKLFKIKWLLYTLGIAFGLFISLVTFIAVYGQNDNVTYAEDAVIVLGAGIRGEQVTSALAYRLDKAVEYSHKNPDAVIVVSGGQGFQETITEALAMEKYLINRGVAKAKIIKEENATSTYTNFSNSQEILDGYFKRPYKIALITNDFHIYRATRIAKTIGLDCTHYHAEILWYTIPGNYLRESAAVIKTWLMGG